MDALFSPAATVSNTEIVAPVNYPEIPDSSGCTYIDLDYLDPHKIATDPRFVIRDGLNERRW